MLENTEMANPQYQEKFGLVIKKTEITTHHTKPSSCNSIKEYQNLVIATDTLPHNDWVRTRIFCWTISLLYFNKILQIPLLIFTTLFNTSLKDILEFFLEENEKSPQLLEIHEIFKHHALRISGGASEYIHSKKWLDLYWPADEYVFIMLCKNNKLDVFYDEIIKLIQNFSISRSLNIPDDLIADLVKMNKNLIKIPFTNKGKKIHTNYNIWEAYKSGLKAQTMQLEKIKCCYEINTTRENWTSWDEWCREVVWYGTKKGAYLHDAKRIY